MIARNPILQTRGRGFRDDFFADLVLPVFRATGAAWSAAKYPAQATEFKNAAARAYAAYTASYAAYGASYAAHAAAHAADTADAADAASHAADAYADAASAAAAYADAAAMWSGVSIDARSVEESAAASIIAGLPLCPQGQPDQLRSLWQEMKAALLATKQDWQVWTDWYDDRLNGHVREEERELAYVRIEEGLWNEGPAVANAEIKRYPVRKLG